MSHPPVGVWPRGGDCSPPPRQACCDGSSDSAQLRSATPTPLAHLERHSAARLIQAPRSQGTGQRTAHRRRGQRTAEETDVQSAPDGRAPRVRTF